MILGRTSKEEEEGAGTLQFGSIAMMTRQLTMSASSLADVCTHVFYLHVMVK